MSSIKAMFCFAFGNTYSDERGLEWYPRWVMWIFGVATLWVLMGLPGGMGL